MIDPDDEAGSFFSCPQCDVPLELHQPAALVNGKG
jgi:primosomal protein N'